MTTDTGKAGDLITFLKERIDEDERYLKSNRRHLWTQRPLREVAAKRAVIGRYERACTIPEPVASFTAGQDDGYREACMDAIGDLAAIWNDHPDYRQGWAAPQAVKDDGGEEREHEPITDVAMVCTECRNPVERFPGLPGWQHTYPWDGPACSAGLLGIKAVAAAGSEEP